MIPSDDVEKFDVLVVEPVETPGAHSAHWVAVARDRRPCGRPGRVLVIASAALLTPDRALEVGTSRIGVLVNGIPAGGERPLTAEEIRQERLEDPTVQHLLAESRRTSFGLALIVIGFLLQIGGTWF